MEKTNSKEKTKRNHQILSFDKIQSLMLQNVSKTQNKTYTQYTKEKIIDYLKSPSSNVDNIREVSRFLLRYSMIYKKLITYYATAPLYNYHMAPTFDLNKNIDFTKFSKNYYDSLKKMNLINMPKEMTNIVQAAVRDGVYFGFFYDTEGKDGCWIHWLDPQYCKLSGKTSEGKWIFKFNAAYFDKGNNKEFVLGNNIDNDNTVLWDECFVNGYQDYKNKGRDYQWFYVTPEKSIALIAGNEDEFDVPLPYFTPLFIELLDLLDLESLLTQRTALENYMLLVSKIPMIDGSEDVDDFAVSLDLVQGIQELIDSAVPDLVGTAYTPLELEPITFNKSNNTDMNDMISASVTNLYNNAGASQLVVSGGASTNSIGLSHALENDLSNTWTWINRLETEINAYIKYNIFDGIKFEFHKMSWYNQEEYIARLKDSTTLGGDVLPYLSALHGNDYLAICALQFENQLGIKQIMTPLQTSFTMSGNTDNKSGRPKKSENDLSAEGINTRDEKKNEKTKANK